MYGFITMTNPWGYVLGYLVGALFIGIVAPIVCDFNVSSEEESSEDVDLDDIEITFE